MRGLQRVRARDRDLGVHRRRPPRTRDPHRPHGCDTPAGRVAARIRARRATARRATRQDCRVCGLRAHRARHGAAARAVRSAGGRPHALAGPLRTGRGACRRPRRHRPARRHAAGGRLPGHRLPPERRYPRPRRRQAPRAAPRHRGGGERRAGPDRRRGGPLRGVPGRDHRRRDHRHLVPVPGSLRGGRPAVSAVAIPVRDPRQRGDDAARLGLERGASSTGAGRRSRTTSRGSSAANRFATCCALRAACFRPRAFHEVGAAARRGVQRPVRGAPRAALPALLARVRRLRGGVPAPHHGPGGGSSTS